MILIHIHQDRLNQKPLQKEIIKKKSTKQESYIDNKENRNHIYLKKYYSKQQKKDCSSYKNLRFL